MTNEIHLLFSQPLAYSRAGEVCLERDSQCDRCKKECHTLVFCTCDGEYGSIDLCAECLEEFTKLLK
jgi:hypothetical protein